MPYLIRIKLYIECVIKMLAKDVETSVICGLTPFKLEEFGTHIVDHSQTLYRREISGENKVIVDNSGVVIPNNTIRRQLH